MQRMDAWALKKSWAHPLARGYEIKVSRSDFMGDDKWRGYLPCCNEFYFVAPPGVIKPEEVAAEAGLLVCSTNGTRLYAKKKAPYRDVEIPESVYRYVLFSRVNTRQDNYHAGRDKATFWREWLEGKQELQQIGRWVSRSLRKRLSEEIDKRDTEQLRLARELETLKDTRTMLTNLGFAPDHVPQEYQLKRKLAELKRAVPARLIQALRDAEEELSRSRKVLAALVQDTEEPNG
jgi:hypothetical protein